MIWFKEDENLVGYVPILNRTYSTDEIIEMTRLCWYFDVWSNLSQLVMQIQGIRYSVEEDMSPDHIYEIKRLIDIDFKFHFECCNIPSEWWRIQPYTEYVFEVLENMTLYKVATYSRKGMRAEIAKAKRILEPFVSDDALDDISCNVSEFISSAERTSDNFAKLQKLFADRGLVSTHKLFEEVIDEKIRKSFYKKRKITQDFGSRLSDVYWK